MNYKKIYDDCVYITCSNVRHFYLEADGTLYKKIDTGAWRAIFGEDVASLRKQLRSGIKIIFVPTSRITNN